jgi:hypothetical protein
MPFTNKPSSAKPIKAASLGRAVGPRAESVTEMMCGKLWGMTQRQMKKLEETGGLPANSRIARSAVSP